MRFGCGGVDHWRGGLFGAGLSRGLVGAIQLFMSLANVAFDGRHHLVGDVFGPYIFTAHTRNFIEQPLAYLDCLFPAPERVVNRKFAVQASIDRLQVVIHCCQLAIPSDGLVWIVRRPQFVHDRHQEQSFRIVGVGF